MGKQLLIIFAKNPEKGKVKTRLAATLGDQKALDAYISMMSYTRQISGHLEQDKVVYYSSFIGINDAFPENIYRKKTQRGNDLGEKMRIAFSESFDEGYQSVVIIGTDCMELTPQILKDSFKSLQSNDAVIGPAEDGGYYLLGMNQLYTGLFENKKWSSETVFIDTIEDFQQLNIKHHTLPTLTDVDYEEDLVKSIRGKLSNLSPHD